MEHQQIEEQLTAYLLGDLAPEQAEAMRRHLEECDDCRALAKELEPTLDLLRGALAVDAGVPERLDDERKQEIFAPRHVPATVIWLSAHRSVLMRVAGVAAVAVVLFALMMPATNNAIHTARERSGERRLGLDLEELDAAPQPAAPKSVTRRFADAEVAEESVPTLGDRPELGRLFKSKEGAAQPVISDSESFGIVLKENAVGTVKVEAGLTDDAVALDAVEELGDDSSVRYQVKKGDTLTSIAAANETTVRELVELNQLQNPNVIGYGGGVAIADMSRPQSSAEPAEALAQSLQDVEYDSLAVADASSLRGLDLETVTEGKHASERRPVDRRRTKASAGKDLKNDFLFGSSGPAPSSPDAVAVTAAPALPALESLNRAQGVDSDDDGLFDHWGGTFVDERNAEELGVAQIGMEPGSGVAGLADAVEEVALDFNGAEVAHESLSRPDTPLSAGLEIAEGLRGTPTRPAPDPTQLASSREAGAYYSIPEYSDGYSGGARTAEKAKNSMERDFYYEFEGEAMKRGRKLAESEVRERYRFSQAQTEAIVDVGQRTSGGMSAPTEPDSTEVGFALSDLQPEPLRDIDQLGNAVGTRYSTRVDELSLVQSEARGARKAPTVRPDQPVALSGKELQDMGGGIADNDMLAAITIAPADHAEAGRYNVAAKERGRTLGESQAGQRAESLSKMSAQLSEVRDEVALGWSEKSEKKSELSLASVDNMKRLEAQPYAEAGAIREREIARTAQEASGREYSVAPTRKPADVAEVEAEPELESEAELVARAYGVNPFVSAKEQPFSTFAIDVDTAAYTLMRKHIQSSVLPPAEAVRTEEFVNFFDYDYRAPERQTFAVYTSLAPTPFGDGRLLKIGVKGKRLGREEQRPAVLTFVIDTSGSMDTPDRLGLVRRSLEMLIDELGDVDQVAIVQVDSQARLILPPTALAERDAIAAAIDGLQCSGSTHLEDGIKLGYEVAAQAFTGGSVNRVLLLSDGAANLGSANAEQILSMVESHRSQGIFCSVFGFGIGAYNDEILEQLANKGDGSYRFIDSQEEAKRVFVDELAATLHVIASDVKIQVEFYPEQVNTYRQLGYENRQLTKEQFRDDTVDAGEVGSGESVTALYELVAGANIDQPLGVVRVRYRDAATGGVEEIAHPIRMSDAVASFEEASPRFRLAAAAAEFAEILRGSPFADGADYGAVADVLRPVALDLRLDQRVQELLQLVQRAPGLPRASGN